MLAADFVMDGNGAGDGELAHNVTPEMVRSLFYIVVYI